MTACSGRFESPLRMLLALYFVEVQFLYQALGVDLIVVHLNRLQIVSAFKILYDFG
jgi:hypothetical protein